MFFFFFGVTITELLKNILVFFSFTSLNDLGKLFMREISAVFRRMRRENAEIFGCSIPVVFL